MHFRNKSSPGSIQNSSLVTGESSEKEKEMPSVIATKRENGGKP